MITECPIKCNEGVFGKLGKSGKIYIRPEVGAGLVDPRHFPPRAFEPERLCHENNLIILTYLFQ